MTPQLQVKFKELVSTIKPKNTLEIGSLNVNGGVKQFIEGNYTGIDMTPGPGVDILMNGHDILERFGEAKFDLVVCLETLEHDSAFWETLEQIKAVLKPTGHFICSTPTYGFPYHPYPKDYWRFTVDSYEDVIFKSFEILNLSIVNDNAGYPSIIALGKCK